MSADDDILHVVQTLRRNGNEGASLASLSERAGWSPFHLHRAFTRVVGETPKQYTLRLRLEDAAVRLVSSRATVAAIAMATGFASPEVFTRAFRRQFDCTPSEYRRRTLVGSSGAERRRHHALTKEVGPCVSLFHTPIHSAVRSVSMSTLSIVREQRQAQPIMFKRARVARHEIANAIGECLGAVFPYCLKSGLAFAGRPFARYQSTGPGLVVMDVGMPVSALPSETPPDGVEAGELLGGDLLVALANGHYDKLPETYAAMERWMDEQGVRPRGAPWEFYVNDPADFPNPEDWRTEICWPITE